MCWYHELMPKLQMCATDQKQIIAIKYAGSSEKR